MKKMIVRMSSLFMIFGFLPVHALIIVNYSHIPSKDLRVNIFKTGFQKDTWINAFAFNKVNCFDVPFLLSVGMLRAEIVKINPDGTGKKIATIPLTSRTTGWKFTSKFEHGKNSTPIHSFEVTLGASPKDCQA